MHKSFYASGFLYHLKTQQILLHQPSNSHSPSFWSLFGGENYPRENAQQAFQRIIQKMLDIHLDAKYIHPVYDYLYPKKKFHYVFYAEVTDMYDFSCVEEKVLSWFTFKQTLKLSFSVQTKQDIIVAERVIKAHARDKAATSGNFV